MDEQAKNFENDDGFLKNVSNEKKEKSSAKKEKENVPTIENVKAYFFEQHFPELEANKFFNYFCSIGWLVGGKTPMVDWQAAAQNWMLNAPKFLSVPSVPDSPKRLHATTEKDYAEPL